MSEDLRPSDMVRRVTLGVLFSIAPAVFCWWFGRWFGMRVIGLTAPVGSENVAATILGFLAILLFVLVGYLLYLLGAKLDRFMKEQ